MGPNARMPAAVERVHEPGHERGLGAHHHEVDLALLGGRDHVAVREALHAVAGDAGVAGRAQDLGRARAAQERADDRVLAPARPDHEDALAQSAEMKSSTGIAERVS